jgi:hypothetical protein
MWSGRPISTRTFQNKFNKRNTSNNLTKHNNLNNYNNTCSPCDSVLKPRFQKMSAIMCTIPLFKTCIFLTNRPFADNLNPCNTKRNSICVKIQYKKRNCLHVDFSIHKCIQSDFVGWMPQGHVKILDQERSYVSRTRNRKNLLNYVNNENNDYNWNNAKKK